MRQGENDRGRVAVLALVGVLCVGAAVLIAKIVGGSDHSETAGKVVYTALALTIFGASAVTGLHLAERRPGQAGFGYLTAVIALLGFAAVAIHIVGEGVFLGGDWHLQGVGLALTLTLAQAAIVLAYDRREDPIALRLASAGTIVSILALGVLAGLAAADSDVSISEQLIATLAALYLLGAALVVVLRIDVWSRRRSGVGSVPLDHVVIAVSDRAAAVSFYTGLLGAEVVERPEGRIAFRVGEQLLNVHEPHLEPAAPLARQPVRPGNSDLCFAWPATPRLAVQLIEALGAELVGGPVPRTGARGPGQSVYCRDPDGTLIELIAYA